MQTVANVGLSCMRHLQSIVQVAVRPWQCSYLLSILLRWVYDGFEKNQTTDGKHVAPCYTFPHSLLRKHVNQRQFRSHNIIREGYQVRFKWIDQYNNLGDRSITALQNSEYSCNQEQD